MKHDKLVRDLIPDKITERGANPITHIASDEEYQMRLKAKLLEETQEFLETPTAEELADILEVVYALCDVYGFDRKQLETLRRNKVEEKGAFIRRIVLDEIEE